MINCDSKIVDTHIGCGKLGVGLPFPCATYFVSLLFSKDLPTGMLYLHLSNAVASMQHFHALVIA